MIGDHPLTPWEKLSIIFLGGGVVSFTLLLVVCFVCPTCCKISHFFLKWKVELSFWQIFQHSN